MSSNRIDSQLAKLLLDESQLQEEPNPEDRYKTGFRDLNRDAASPPSDFIIQEESKVARNFVGNYRVLKGDTHTKSEINAADEEVVALLGEDSDSTSQANIQRPIEEQNAIYARIRLLEHLFMIAWLALIILLWLKEYAPDVAGYNYLVAFGLPGSAMAITGCDVIYERQIRPFQQI